MNNHGSGTIYNKIYYYICIHVYMYIHMSHIISINPLRILANIPKESNNQGFLWNYCVRTSAIHNTDTNLQNPAFVTCVQ